MNATITPERSPIKRELWLWFPLFVFVFSRIIILTGAYVSDRPLPDDWDPHPSERSENYPSTGPLGMWMRWDTQWYLSIVDRGYQYAPGNYGSTGFFPLYPLTIYLANPLFGGNTLLTGLVLSNLYFLLALMVLARLIYDHFTRDSNTIQRSLFYIAVFPSAFHFAAPYTESLYLLLSVIVFLAAYQRRWWLAAVGGALASATRLPGLLLMLPVGLLWAESHGWTLGTMRDPQAWANLWDGLRQDFLTVLMLLIGMPLGLIVYAIYLWRRFDAPLAFIEIQEINTTGQDFNLSNNIERLLRGEVGNIVYFAGLLTVLGVCIISIYIWRRWGSIPALYCISMMMTAVAGNVYTGIPRYGSILFPVFIMLGVWGRYRWLDLLIKIIWPPLLALNAFLFVQWFKV